ncbi:hypothetical protein QBZ16_002122 [Prototheca wickerhamii]|uniref:Uncharacterized protein n=1 Tax=Prototheca wickerhamii TaxID=3111 RepID=A0AAD9MJD8_PROWI|nr:hypothetical protein QBZ16_002122 [Prototheca wickerhamii]
MEAGPSDGDLYERQQRLIANYHRKRSRGQHDAAKAMLKKSVFELLAERQLIPAVNLIKLMLQSMREDGDATNEEAVAAMDTIWKLFGSKVQNDAEAALLTGLVNDFCRLLQQQLGEDDAQELIIAEHRLLATLLSKAVPERLGVYLPFAVSGFKPASSFLPVIERTFPSSSEAPVDERQLAMTRVLLAYAAAWAPAPAALAQLRESVAEYKAAVQGSPAPLIQFVDMFVQALEARKVEQARQLIQFYRKLLEYDDQILKSAKKGVDAIAGSGGFSPLAALLRGR